MKYVFKLLLTVALVASFQVDTRADATFTPTLRTNGDFSNDNDADGAFNNLGYHRSPQNATSQAMARFQMEMRFHANVPDGELSFPLDIKQDIDYRYYIEWHEDGELEKRDSSDGWVPDDAHNEDEDLTLSAARNIYEVDSPGINNLNLNVPPYDAYSFEPGDKFDYFANFRTWVRGHGPVDYDDTQNWNVHIILKIDKGPNYDENPWDVILVDDTHTCTTGLADLPDL